MGLFKGDVLSSFENTFALIILPIFRIGYLHNLENYFFEDFSLVFLNFYS